MSDELPAILILGKYKARLLTEWKQNGETQQSWAALPEIIALVAALSREQQDAVFGERWQAPPEPHGGSLGDGTAWWAS